jgi:hypothetical protein
MPKVPYGPEPHIYDRLFLPSIRSHTFNNPSPLQLTTYTHLAEAPDNAAKKACSCPLKNGLIQMSVEPPAMLRMFPVAAWKPVIAHFLGTQMTAVEQTTLNTSTYKLNTVSYSNLYRLISLLLKTNTNLASTVSNGWFHDTYSETITWRDLQHELTCGVRSLERFSTSARGNVYKWLRTPYKWAVHADCTDWGALTERTTYYAVYHIALNFPAVVLVWRVPVAKVTLRKKNVNLFR